MYGDTARFYDLIHDGAGRDARAEAELVIGEARLRTPDALSLLDVGCGTGAHLVRFAEEFDVVGVDLSPQMLAIAGRRLPGVPLVEGWVEPSYWIEGLVDAQSARSPGLAVSRAVRSSRSGMLCEVVMRYVVATPDALTTVDEHHTMRLSDPIEMADAYGAAGFDCARLPHVLHPGRSLYAGVKARTSSS